MGKKGSKSKSNASGKIKPGGGGKKKSSGINPI